MSASSEQGKLTGRDIHQQIRDHLYRGPASPDFAQSTVKYCEDGIYLALTAVGSALIKQYPSDGQKIKEVVTKMQLASLPLLESSLAEDAGRLVLKVPHSPKVLSPLSILKSVYYANAELGNFRYAIKLYPPRIKSGSNIPTPVKDEKRFPAYASRFRSIVKIGNFSLTSPEAKIMAVGYLTFLTKIDGADTTRKLLDRVKDFSGIADRKQIPHYLGSIWETIKSIKQAEAGIKTGLATIDTIANEVGFNEEQVQLLFDLAFIKNKALEQPDEFKRVFHPIIHFIAESNWNEALKHRDFLLRFFGSSFPEWRQKDFEKKTGIHPYTSLRGLAEAAKRGKVSIPENEVPDKYKDFFENTFEKTLERSWRERSSEIVQKSNFISSEILKEIALEDMDDGFYVLPTKIVEDRVKGTTTVSGVYIDNGKQICRVTTKDGYEVERNFGRVLYDQIKLANQLDLEKAQRNNIIYENTLSGGEIQALSSFIQAAFQRCVQRSPHLSFTPYDYLRALMRSAHIPMGKNDLTYKFTEQFRSKPVIKDK